MPCGIVRKKRNAVNLYTPHGNLDLRPPAREVISAHSADLNRGMHGRTLSYFADEVYERFDDDVLRRKGKCRQ